MRFFSRTPADFLSNQRLALVAGFAVVSLWCVQAGAQQNVSLAWNPPVSGTATGYALYLGNASGVYNQRINVGTNLVVTITGLASGTTKYFTAKAYNSAGVESPTSNEAQFMATSTNTPPPTNPPVFAAPPLRIINNSGRLLVSAASVSNLAWVLQTSTNLTNWSCLFTNPAAQSLSYSPVVSSGQGWHYYRGVAVGGSVNSNSLSAALAAGQVTANAVGYLRLNAIARGNTLLANPFSTSNNTVAALLPSVPTGAVLYEYTTGAGYTSNTFTTAGWTMPAMTITPGDGGFLYNPGKNAIKLLFAGEILQGTVTNRIPLGYSIASSLIPLPNALTTLPAARGDVIQTYQGKWVSYTNVSGTWVGAPKSVPLLLNPGSAVFITKATAANWVQSWSPAD